MSGTYKLRTVLIVITILTLSPIMVSKAAAAPRHGLASSHGSAATDHLTNTSSGVLAPRFQTAPSSLSTTPTGPSQTLQSLLGLGISSNTNTGVPSSLAGQSSSSVDLLSGFDGLNQIQSCACAPPDVQLAAGLNQLVEMVNLEGAIFTKQGITNQTFSLSTFFRSGADMISDPKVLYDNASQRWFATLADITINSVLFAVSTTNNPAGQWVFYTISAGSFLPDQPIIGISDDKVAVAANDFSGNTFAGSQFWIINKSQLLAGVTANFFTSGANSGVFSVHPAQSLSPTTTQYMVSDIVVRRAISTTSLRLFSVTGVPGVSTVNVLATNLAVSTIGTSGGTIPGGVQPGTTATVNPNDIRIQQAVWYKGSLWTAFDDACTPTGDTQLRGCIRLTKIATTSPAISQDFDLGINGQYNFYPAISIDKNGNLLVLYGYSNSTVFPSLAVTGQLATDPAGSLAPPRTLKVGLAADTSTRYGDYFGAALDPTDPSIVWAAGEYHDTSTGSCQSFGSCWSTFIGSASMTGFTVSASPKTLRVSAVSGANSNVTLTGINGFAGPVTITTSHNSGIIVSPVQTVKNITTTGSVTITLSFSASSTLSPGNYTVTISGANGTLLRQSTLTLTVFPDFEISLACSCSAVTISPGSQLPENLTLTGVNGFTGTVHLTTSITPTVSGGPTVSLNQANQTLTNGQNTIATLTIAGGNFAGMFTLTFSGACLTGACTMPDQQHSTNLSLMIASTGSSGGGGGGGSGRIMML